MTATIESVEAQHAADAGLRYVSDAQPGIRRLRRGRGFSYKSASGQTVRDQAVLDRIAALVIPPAWTDVWICHRANGHLQATGRDAKGRKQYRYHARWRKIRDDAKYSKMLEFGLALPAIREATEADLDSSGLGRDKVIATCVRVLDEHVVRIGNTTYARDNDSYGLTTMRCKHALISSGTVRFVFRGKSGKKASFEITDGRLTKVIQRCRTLPGQDLFQYLDDSGESRVIGSSDVNDYLQRIAGQDFTAKAFRTWAGSVAAYEYLASVDTPSSKTQSDKCVVEAVKVVAERLGNTPAVARSSYIHPLVLDEFLTAGLPPCNHPRAGLSAAESALIRLLESEAKAAAA